jgi:hypothetical protein
VADSSLTPTTKPAAQGDGSASQVTLIALVITGLVLCSGLVFLLVVKVRHVFWYKYKNLNRDLIPQVFKWRPCQRMPTGPAKYLVLSPGDSDDDDAAGHDTKKYEVQLLTAPASFFSMHAVASDEDEDDVIV